MKDLNFLDVNFAIDFRKKKNYTDNGTDDIQYLISTNPGDYFMDDATFQKELSDDQFYADVRKKYGSRGVAQAKKIKEQTSALFAGGELSEEDQANFIKEMEALFLDAKEEAKKFTPKKYL